MNKKCSGDPSPGVSGQEQPETGAAASVLTQSPVLTPGHMLEGCSVSPGLMGPTKVAVTYLLHFFLRSQLTLFYTVRSLTFRPFLEIFAFLGALYYSCSYTDCAQ